LGNIVRVLMQLGLGELLTSN